MIQPVPYELPAQELFQNLSKFTAVPGASRGVGLGSAEWDRPHSSGLVGTPVQLGDCWL